MMKKIKICFLVLLLICAIHVNVNAADTDIFSTTNAEGAKDEEVTIYLSLNKELEFAAADFTLEYDTSMLEYVKYTGLDIIKDSAMHIVNNNSETGKIAFGYVSKPDTATSVKQPGNIISITFKIKSDEVETTNVDIKCTSLKKDSGENIEASDIQSEIKIIEKKEDSSENTENPESENAEDINNNNSTSTQDSEEKPQLLPKTGEGLFNIISFAFVLLLITLYVYKKYNDLKNE